MTKQHEKVLKYLIKQCSSVDYTHLTPDSLRHIGVINMPIEKVNQSLIYLQATNYISFKYFSCHANDLKLGIDVKILEKGYEYKQTKNNGKSSKRRKTLAWIVGTLLTIISLIIALFSLIIHS